MSVRPSVRWSVGRSVRHTRVEFPRNGPNSNKIASGIRKYAIWKTIKRQVRGQFARTHLLSELCSTCSLAPLCLFHSHASLSSFVCLLAHFPAWGEVNDYGWDVRLSHSRMETEESSLASTISNNNNNYKVVVSYK